MANIQFEGVQRVFKQNGKEFVALQDINLEVQDREFVAIVGPQGDVLQREAFRIGFSWPENRSRVGSVEDLEPRIALASPDRAGEYRIWVGLQLTAEQLAWNRSGAARR